MEILYAFLIFCFVVFVWWEGSNDWDKLSGRAVLRAAKEVIIAGIVVSTVVIIGIWLFNP